MNKFTLQHWVFLYELYGSESPQGQVRGNSGSFAGFEFATEALFRISSIQ
jgi:hypothetical protein